jgi:1-deoxyxylulose-5-phosphate synthase
MNYRTLGRSGLEVSRLCFGCMSFGSTRWREWVLEEPDARPFYQRAIEAGINFFDTADMYSDGRSEEITGALLRELTKREDVVIATKVYFPHADSPNRGGLSRKHIMHACELSLRRLGTDYIDLYQIHRYDTATPVDETLSALDRLVQDGKVRYLGASSMYAWQFAQALALADRRGWSRFISMQNHYNLVYREEEREMLPLCRAEGIGVIPWSPLARGVLTGTRTREKEELTLRARTDDYTRGMYTREADYDVADAVKTLAAQRGLPPAQIALAWLLHQPIVTAPIIGSTKLSHLNDAIAALDVALSDDEIAFLEAPYQPHPVLGMAAPARR